LRTISPSEATQFQFCPKLWFYSRKLGLVPRDIGFKELAGMMGSTVGWMIEQHYGGHQVSLEMGVEYFHQQTDQEIADGRKWGWGVEAYMEKVEWLIRSHYESVLANEQVWLQGGRIVAIEPIMLDWGRARQDMVLEDTRDDGVVLDWKCKIKADSDKFSISRDIDLYGNQAELYPLSWNSSDRVPKIKKVRFVYLMEGKAPLVEDRRVDHRRSERWLQGYMNTVMRINQLELSPQMEDQLTENPYHITPWGYPCEFRDHCTQGEHSQGVLEGFIQVERRVK